MALNGRLSVLADFEKRMQFINIVRFILDYEYPNDISCIFADRQILDNVIISVLLYISEQSLGGEECGIEDIRCFIDSFIPLFAPDKDVDALKLTKFIVYTALMHKGERKEYFVFDSRTEKFVKKSVRLITEKNCCLDLTDEAFDFIFHSKEIESKIDNYSVSRFKEQMYLKRNNYKKALEQSKDLYQRIDVLIKDINNFQQKCRENINKVSIEKYEEICGKYRSVLDEEYKELNNINEDVRERRRRLQEKFSKSEEDAENIKDLVEIERNIDRAAGRQQDLIILKNRVSDLYSKLLTESFSYADNYERMDLEYLMNILRTSDLIIEPEFFVSFMHCISKPITAKQFNPELFYEDNAPAEEKKSESGINLEFNKLENKDLKRFERFTSVCCRLFAFAASREIKNSRCCFLVSDFISSLNEKELEYMCEENALPNVIMSLYEMQSADIKGWNKEHHSELNGEFDLASCLEKVPKEYLNLSEFNVLKKDGSAYRFDAGCRSIEISNLYMEAVYE